MAGENETERTKSPTAQGETVTAPPKLGKFTLEEVAQGSGKEGPPTLKDLLIEARGVLDAMGEEPCLGKSDQGDICGDTFTCKNCRRTQRASELIEKITDEALERDEKRRDMLEELFLCVKNQWDSKTAKEYTIAEEREKELIDDLAEGKS